MNEWVIRVGVLPVGEVMKGLGHYSDFSSWTYLSLACWSISDHCKEGWELICLSISMPLLKGLIICFILLLIFFINFLFWKNRPPQIFSCVTFLNLPLHHDSCFSQVSSWGEAAVWHHCFAVWTVRKTFKQWLNQLNKNHKIIDDLMDQTMRNRFHSILPPTSWSLWHCWLAHVPPAGPLFPYYSRCKESCFEWMNW